VLQTPVLGGKLDWLPPKCQQDTNPNTLMEAIEINPNAKRSTSHKVTKREQQLNCSSFEDV
jgi:hypothetical protein